MSISSHLAKERVAIEAFRRCVSPKNR